MRPIFGAGVRQITKSMDRGVGVRPCGSVGIAPSIYGGAPFHIHVRRGDAAGNRAGRPTRPRRPQEC